MIIEHFATLHSKDEVSIPNRVASCQIDILLSAVCIKKKLHSKWNSFARRHKKRFALFIYIKKGLLYLYNII